MKSHTDIPQSKQLIEILPIESADMCYIQDLLAGGKYGEYKPYVGDLIPAYGQDKIRCWSLSALLAQMPCAILQVSNDGYYRVFMPDYYSDWHDNPIDACVELLERARKEEELILL